MRNLKVETPSNGQEVHTFTTAPTMNVENGVLYCLTEDVKVVYAPGTWVSAVLEADDAKENA